MDKKKFFDTIRQPVFRGSLTPSQVAGCDTLIDAMQAAHWPINWAAYGLATAFHETARTMQPIAEYGKGKGRKYGVPGKYGQVPYGRGYVQLTWDFNYEKADKELGLKGALLRDFDLAMDPGIAARIMIQGMSAGWFTGRKLAHYLTASGSDYVSARKIINGNDKASEIAALARKFEAGLKAGMWGAIEPSQKPAEPPKPQPPPTPTQTPQPAPQPPQGGFFTRFWRSLSRKLKGQ